MDFDEDDYPMETVNKAYAKEQRRTAWRDFQLSMLGIGLLWYGLDADHSSHADFAAIFVLIYAVAVFLGRLMTARH